MRQLKRLTIRNYKSVLDQTLELGPLNVFIGGNGAGKSNLIEAFRLLREIVTDNLQNYTIRKGGADTLLHFGRQQSPTMEFYLEFGAVANMTNAYRVILGSTEQDQLFIHQEIAYYHEKSRYQNPYVLPIASAVWESELSNSKHICATQVLADLQSYRVYHFHDTSDTAKAKGSADVEDNKFLRSQAENLPAFLYWLQQTAPVHFKSIESTIRQIAPFFDRFQLEPSRLNPDKIRLEWREKGNDAYFNASSLSDGTLRFICLTTLLLQPSLPSVVLLDEPELGLHPAAITLLAALLKAAANRTQVIVATQSVTLINQFEPKDIWTVDRFGQGSIFSHLNKNQMKNWLEDYALGELWEKNILGARP